MFNDKEVLYYTDLHLDKDYKKQAREIRKEFPKAVTVLEIGAGTGNLTRYLVENGFKITALEPSKDMASLIPIDKRRIINKRIEEYKTTKKFDLVIASYDVLNYVSFRDIESVKNKINCLSDNVYIEMWPQGKIKFFTFKKGISARRIRLAIKLFGAIYILFIYWGYGLFFSFHKLFHHK